MATAPDRPASASRRLWLSLSLPNLPLDALCRGGIPRDEPVVVATARGAGAQVVAGDTRARARDVRAGMRLSAALALAPGLRVVERDEAAERSALEGLAAWAGRFTSRVCPIPAQGLLLEVGGSQALFGGLAPLRTRVREEIRRLGYTASVAIAPTPLGAWWLARAGFEEPVTECSALPGRLARVPVACLDLPGETEEALRAMGLQRVGDCARLPRDGLARRLGPAFVARLDRALGRSPDPREPWRPPPRFERRVSLPTAVEAAEAVLFAVKRLLLELSGFLSLRRVGVRCLELTLFPRMRGPVPIRPIPIRIQLLSATRDPEHLMGLLREHLMRLELGAPEAAVEAIELRARDLAPLTPRNLDLFEVRLHGGRSEGAREARGEWDALIERLGARLDPESVRGVVLVANHRPERAWRYHAPEGEAPGRDTGGKGARGEEAREAAGPARPLWLLAKPRLLETADGRPCLGGPLSLRPGPERIESGWWDGGGVARDYFVARNPRGEWYWVFRERCAEPRWFLHGVFG